MSTNLFNPVAPELVVHSYFSLVQAIAKKIKRRLPAHVDIDDLVQTGVIGLLEASGRYDASRAVDFASYANSRITGAILDELRKSDPCSRHDRKRAREAEEVKSRLRGTTGHEPSREQVAAAVGVGLMEYERMLQRLESGKQNSAYCNEDDQTTPDEISQLPSKDETPFETCSKREDFKVLKSQIDQLKPRHREILKLYYYKDLGLKEIGERLGVGEARVCQLHKQALMELRRLIDRKRSPTSTTSRMIQ